MPAGAFYHMRLDGERLRYEHGLFGLLDSELFLGPLTCFLDDFCQDLTPLVRFSLELSKKIIPWSA